MHTVSRGGWNSDRSYLAVVAVTTVLVIIAMAATLSRDVWAVGPKVVMRSDMQGWSMHGATCDFVLDPSSPSGAGVLRYSTPEVSSRVYISMPVIGLKYTRDLDASYATKRLTGSVYAAPGFSFQIDMDGDMSTTGDRFSAMYEPRYNNPGNAKNYSEWNVWDINQDSLFWYNGAKPPTVTTHTAPLRQALMGNESTARLISVRINQGTSNTGWLTLVDSVRLFDATYDFEPILGPSLVTPNHGVIINTNQSTQMQSWASITGVTSYIYESYTEDPIANPFATPVLTEQISGATRSIHTSITEGTYYWRVKAAAPFSSEWSEVRSFTVDNTAPVVAITAPTDDGQTVSGTVAVEGTVVDHSAYTATLRIVDASGVEVATDASTAMPHSYSWDTTSVADGSYTIHYSAVDAAGNESGVASRTVTVHNAPPAPPVTPSPVVPSQPLELPPMPELPPAPQRTVAATSVQSAASAAMTDMLTDVERATEASDDVVSMGATSLGARSLDSVTVAGVSDEQGANRGLYALAWYWWLLIVLGTIALITTWWLAVSRRRRREG